MHAIHIKTKKPIKFNITILFPQKETKKKKEPQRNK